MKKVLPDLLLLLGAGSLSYGAWLAWSPAGFLVAGVMLLVVGIQLARAE